MYQIQKNESSEKTIKRIIQEEIDDALHLLGGPELEIDSAVHETRKSMKRIRAALRLIRQEIGETLFHRENAIYRDVAREIAILRDTAVMVEILELLQNEESSPTAESFPVAYQMLVASKKAAHQKFLDQKDTIPKVITTLTQAKERVKTLPIHHNGFEAFESGLKKVYRRGRRRMKLAYEDGKSPEKFHDWRKRVKYLWHQIEILQPIYPLLLELIANELHQLSDYLGEAHDAAVLSKYIQDNHEIFKEEPKLEQLLTRLEQRQQALETAAHPLGLRLYAEKPDHFTQRLSVYWDVFQN